MRALFVSQPDQRIVDRAKWVLSLPLYLAGLAALCSGLSACDDKSASGSPEAGLDGAAATGGDAANRESDGMREAADAASSRGDADSSPWDGNDDSTSTGPARGGDAEAGSSGTDSGGNAGGDATPPSLTAATAYLGNPAHTSSVVDPSLAPPLAAIWSFEPQVATTFSYPLIAGGRVYFVYSSVSVSTDQLIAVDEHTGATIWGPVGLGPSIDVGQTYDGEHVFTLDNGGVVRAFNAATGAASWTYTLAGLTAFAGQPTAYRGLFYVVDNGVLTALDEATGQVRWTAPVGGAGLASPAVTDDGVFVALGCQELYDFDRTTGSVLWHHLPACSGSGATPVVFGGRVYVPDIEPTPAHTDVFDATNGGLIATLPCGGFPAFDSGRAYCFLGTGLSAIDLTSGVPTWNFSGDKQLNLTPFAAGGAVYVASNSGLMFGVDESTGALAWPTEADRLGAAGPTVAGEGVLLTELYGGQGVVAYTHFDQPDAGVMLGDGAAPVPVTLVPGASPMAFAVDSTNVYWAEGQVEKLAKSGGQPVVLWSAPNTPVTSIAVDATSVYFVTSAQIQGTRAQIMSVPIAGGIATTLAAASDIVAGPIVAGSTSVYWVDHAVQSIAKGGGTVATIAPDSTAHALAIDASSLYWSASDGIHKMPLAGGAATLIASPEPAQPPLLGASAAAALAVDATNVYYLLNTEAGPGTVGFVPIAGGAPTLLASGRPGGLMAIVVDGQNAYWVEGNGTIQMGSIAAVPKSGGSVSVLVTGLSDPNTVAVDETAVYYPDTVGRGLGKIPK